MEKIIKNLQGLGFSDIEIKVYLYIVDALEASAYEISKDLSIPRATVYKVIDRLKMRGIILETRKNNIKQYHAESYTVLKKELEEKITLATGLIPLLQERSKSAGTKEPVIKMYTNQKGFQLVWDDIMNEYRRSRPPQIYAATHPSLFDAIPGVLKHIRDRHNLGIVGNIIYPESQRDYIGQIMGNTTDQFRFIDDKFGYKGEVTTYGKKVALFTFDKQKPLAIVIESKEMADMIENFLKALWKYSR